MQSNKKQKFIFNIIYAFYWKNKKTNKSPTYLLVTVTDRNYIYFVIELHVTSYFPTLSITYRVDSRVDK